MLAAVKEILRVFDKHSLWDEGVELIGSWCFQLYQKHFGVKYYPFKTQDIDFLIPYPFRGGKNVNLIGELEKLGYRFSFHHDGNGYLWNSEIKIEFITPERGRGGVSSIAIKPLSLRAMPLRFVDILLKDPVCVVEDGIRINVPNPAAFCLHKIIISDRRKRADKTEKDMEQAIYSFKAADKIKLQQLFQSFPKTWQKAIIRNLNNSREIVPLLNEEIDRILFMLQMI